jgi:hypothetical protein
MPNEAEVREQRQRAILAILRRARVRRQAELVEQLADRGFAVTQSSVSRDLRDLAVAKVGGRYLPPASPVASAEAIAEVAHYLRAARPAATSGAREQTRLLHRLHTLLANSAAELSR